jgi:hypothetical protein
VPEGIKRGVSFAFWSSRKALSDILDQLAPDASDEFRSFIKEAPHEWSPPTMDKLRALLPRGVIDSLALVGTAPQVVERLKALSAAGVQEIVIWPFPVQGRTWSTTSISCAGCAAAFRRAHGASVVGCDGRHARTATRYPDGPAGRRLGRAVDRGLRAKRARAGDGDIIVVAQKIVSKAEGRYVDLAGVARQHGPGTSRRMSTRTRAWSRSFSENRDAWCGIGAAC